MLHSHYNPRILIAAAFAFAFAVAVPAMAQVNVFHPTKQPLPSFEVVSVRLVPPMPAGAPPPPPPPPPTADGIHRITTAGSLIREAYGMPYGLDRVIGGEKWLDANRYNIDAKISVDVVQAELKMSKDERDQQSHMRMQSLLTDRFKLKVHFERREMPVYELVITKGTPKLTPAKDLGPDVKPWQQMSTTRKGTLGLELTIHDLTLMDVFQLPFLGLGGRPVVDKTGLTGKYDFVLDFAVSRDDYRPPPGSTDPPPVEDGPSIFTAVQEQLGLKLVPGKAAIEVVVIDSIELPSEN